MSLQLNGSLSLRCTDISQSLDQSRLRAQRHPLSPTKRVDKHMLLKPQSSWVREVQDQIKVKGVQLISAPIALAIFAAAIALLLFTVFQLQEIPGIAAESTTMDSPRTAGQPLIAGAVSVSPVDQAEYVYIPAGDFRREVLLAMLIRQFLISVCRTLVTPVIRIGTLTRLSSIRRLQVPIGSSELKSQIENTSSALKLMRAPSREPPLIATGPMLRWSTIL